MGGSATHQSRAQVFEQLRAIDQRTLASGQEVRDALVERHGAHTQAQLEKGRVAICGCGGLGSTVAVALARIGVGHLHLIDYDVVDMTNLNRQQYSLWHVGQPKTEALRQVIASINPYLDVTCDQVRVTDDNVRGLLAEDRIVAECFDVPEHKTMLVNAVLENFPDKPVVTASGMAGFRSSNLVATRRVARNFYFCGDGETEPKPGAGLMAPRVGVVASHEANMITRILLGEQDS